MTPADVEEFKAVVRTAEQNERKVARTIRSFFQAISATGVDLRVTVHCKNYRTTVQLHPPPREE